jgi:hypothetical protein
MVLGLELPADVSRQVDALVTFMCGECYLCDEEAARIPTIRQQGPGVL